MQCLRFVLRTLILLLLTRKAQLLPQFFVNLYGSCVGDTRSLSLTSGVQFIAL